MPYLIKILTSALLIVFISELAKRAGFWWSLLAALPIISLLSMVWIYLDTKDVAKVSAFSIQVFWFVLPSLGFFLALPFLLTRFSFAASLALASLVSIGAFAVMVGIFRAFGYQPF